MRPADLQLFSGSVSHHRFSPKKHRFTYKVFQLCLNIKKPEKIDQISAFWSSKRANLVRFDRRKFMPSERDLFAEVQRCILQQTEEHFDGDVFLIANLSYWGHCYNPATFFACYDGDCLRYLICEIHNTPWGERFCYVHSVDDSSQTTSQEGAVQTTPFEKRFHVSPFMPMDLLYQWRYRISDEEMVISMNLRQHDTTIFNATLNLKGEELTKTKATLLPFRYPFMCMKVLFGIYWQAFRLWCKGLKFYRHPKSDAAP